MHSARSARNLRILEGPVSRVTLKEAQGDKEIPSREGGDDGRGLQASAATDGVDQHHLVPGTGRAAPYTYKYQSQRHRTGSARSLLSIPISPVISGSEQSVQADGKNGGLGPQLTSSSSSTHHATVVHFSVDRRTRSNAQHAHLPR
jgi:hypothetical protein